MAEDRPIEVTADRNKREFLIRWEDHHESRYSFDGLRAVCPCVECKGGHAHMGQPPDPRKVKNEATSGLNLEQVEAVGSYALQITWTDGHSTGIYTWSYLRAACPCRQCLPD
jgi:DUF971 family protein